MGQLNIQLRMLHQSTRDSLDEESIVGDPLTPFRGDLISRANQGGSVHLSDQRDLGRSRQLWVRRSAIPARSPAKGTACQASSVC